MTRPLTPRQLAGLRRCIEPVPSFPGASSLYRRGLVTREGWGRATRYTITDAGRVALTPRGVAPLQIPFDQYSAIDAVNWSTLKHMAKSPAHYRYALETPRVDAAHFRIGRAAHTAVFEPRRFPLDYAVYLESKVKGEGAKLKWEAFKEANAGRTILSGEEYAQACSLGDSVRAHPVAKRYLAAGLPEQTLTWTDRETGIACKGRVDWISTSEPALCDLKTDRDTDVRRIQNVFARLMYYAQIAWYIDGWEAAHGQGLRPIFIVAEKAAPFDVGVFLMHDDFRAAGREMYRGLLHQLAECNKSGKWPGRYPNLEVLDAPRWMDDHAGVGDGAVTEGDEELAEVQIT